LAPETGLPKKCRPPWPKSVMAAFGLAGSLADLSFSAAKQAKAAPAAQSNFARFAAGRTTPGSEMHANIL